MKKLILKSNEIFEEKKLEEDNKSYISKLKYLMEQIIIKSKESKKNKISLYKIRGFEPYSIFNNIDSISSGLINSKDLEDFFPSNYKIKYKQYIPLFIREYNKRETSNNLTLIDFINFINFNIEKDKIEFGSLDYTKDNINKIFLKLIESEFELIKQREKIIKEIKKIKEFSTYEAFNIISKDKKFIDKDDINIFLDKKYNECEIKELIYRLDLNNNSKISYIEFQDLFFPFQTHLDLEENDDDENNEILLKANPYYIDTNEGELLIIPKFIDIIKNNNFENINDYKDENLSIKYDENLLKEINEKETE